MSTRVEDLEVMSVTLANLQRCVDTEELVSLLKEKIKQKIKGIEIE